MRLTFAANSIGLLAVATFLGAPDAYGAGVAAGTLIHNTASASYGSGSRRSTVDSNTVTIRVDELLDATVSSLDAAALPLATSAVLTYRIENTGNGAEAFSVTASPSVSGNGFDAQIAAVVLDANNNGIFEPGIDTTIINGGSTPALAPDAGIHVFVVVSQPAGTVDGAAGQVRLTAQALTGAGSPGTTYAGQGQGGGDAVVGATTANANALGSLVARAASVVLAKSYTLADPFGGTRPVPGAVVTFTIAVTATGSGAVDDLRVSDAVPSGTTYVANSVLLDGVAMTDAADGDAASASPAGIDVALGTTAAGASRTISFKTTIN